MIKLKNKKHGFTVLELSLYVGLFGIITFVLFNVFGGVINLNKLGKSQNETVIRYRINPVEFNLDFPTKAIVPPNATLPFPDDPVKIGPGMWQSCDLQLMHGNCEVDGVGECWVCNCVEESCNDVSGCALCHKGWIEDPLNDESCTCVDIRSALQQKRDQEMFNIGSYVHYWYDIFNPDTLNIIPILSPETIINNPIPPRNAVVFGMHNYYQFAWSDNLGWINFENIKINPTSGILSGLATVINGGDQISFNCQDIKSCSKSNYGVTLNTTTNELEGYAWSDNFGWISFNCNTGGENQANICSTSDYKVTIDPANGTWDGYAWAGNIGWISFNCNTGGENQANICSTSDYKVMDNRTNDGIIKYEFDILYEGETINQVQEFVYNTHRSSSISEIIPSQGNAGTEVSITSITGSYFYPRPIVKLVQAGSLPIFSKDNFTFVSQDLITSGKFDLRNAKPGIYDLYVIDFYGNTSFKKAAFTVK